MYQSLRFIGWVAALIGVSLIQAGLFVLRGMISTKIWLLI